MTYDGSLYIDGDSTGVGVANSDIGIGNVSTVGRGLGYPAMAAQVPPVSVIPKGAAAAMFYGWNDMEYVNGGEKPTASSRERNYNKYVDTISTRAEQIKERTGERVVIVGLERAPGVKDMGEYGTAAEIARVNSALKAAADKAGAEFFIPHTGRIHKDNPGNPHFTKAQSKQILDDIRQVLGNEKAPAQNKAILVAQNSGNIDLPLPAKTTAPEHQLMPAGMEQLRPVSKQVLVEKTPATAPHNKEAISSHARNKGHHNPQDSHSYQASSQHHKSPDKHRHGEHSQASHHHSPHAKDAHHHKNPVHQKAKEILHQSGITEVHDTTLAANTTPRTNFHLGRGVIIT